MSRCGNTAGSSRARPGRRGWPAGAARELQALVLLSFHPRVLMSLTHCCSGNYFSRKRGAGAEQGSGSAPFPGWHQVLDPSLGWDGMGWESQTWRALEILQIGPGERRMLSQKVPPSPSTLVLHGASVPVPVPVPVLSWSHGYSQGVHPSSTGGCHDPGDPAVALGTQLCPCGCSAPPREVPASSSAGCPRQGLIAFRKNDTNSSYLFWKDLLGRGEQDLEGAWRAGSRGRQLPVPGTSLPAPGPLIPSGTGKTQPASAGKTQPGWCRMRSSPEVSPREGSPGICAGRCPRWGPQSQPVLGLTPNPHPRHCPQSWAVTLNSS